MISDYISELAEKAKAFDRLQSIVARRNEMKFYVVEQSVESILTKLETQCDEEEANDRKSRALDAQRQAKTDVEMAALNNFRIGDRVTFERSRGHVEEGKVVALNREGLVAPNLGISTGSWSERTTGKPALIKPVEHKIQLVHRLFKDGDQWCCVGPDFLDLATSQAGFGDTEEEAIASYKEDA